MGWHSGDRPVIVDRNGAANLAIGAGRRRGIHKLRRLRAIRPTVSVNRTASVTQPRGKSSAE